MRTTFVMDPPPIVEDWLAERRALGQDLYDEVWEGEYHVAAAPNDAHSDVQFQLAEILGPLARAAGLRGRGPSNIGRPKDFRVPDLVFLRGTPDPVWQPTAAIVVEIVSPGDESRKKVRPLLQQERRGVPHRGPGAAHGRMVRARSGCVPTGGREPPLGPHGGRPGIGDRLACVAGEPSSEAGTGADGGAPKRLRGSHIPIRLWFAV